MAVNIPRESRSLSSLRLNASGVDGILLHQGEEFRLRILECAMRSGVDGVKFSIEADTDNRTSVTVQEARVIGLRIENGARCFSITENDVQIIRRSPAYFAPLPLEFRDLPGREYIVQGKARRRCSDGMGKVAIASNSLKLQVFPKSAATVKTCTGKLTQESKGLTC